MQKNYKKLILISFLIFSLSSIFASGRRQTKLFSLDSSLGFRNIVLKEYVYASDHTTSRLDWQAPFVPVVSVGGRFNIYNAIIDLSVLSAIPVKIGKMEDWDWLTSSDYSRATRYSFHDLITSKHFDAEAKIGYDFNLLDFGVPFDLSIIPQVGFLYRNQKYEAQDGYTQYASDGSFWDSSLDKTYIRGIALTYEQMDLMPFVHLEANFKLVGESNSLKMFSGFRGKVFARFYPYIYASAMDNHYMRSSRVSYTGYQFNDYMKEGRGFLVGTELSWKSFCVSFCYEWFSASKGKSTGRVIGYDSTLESFSTIPGTDSSIFQAAFTYRF